MAARYERLKARRGPKKAAIAVGHSILVRVYYLLQRGTVYEDPGGHDFDERDRQAAKRRYMRGLEALGYQVASQPIPPAA